VRDPLAAALNLPAVADSEATIRARVDELIEVMGIGAFRDKFISELSTGSRRIVDLACILAHDPSVILFDEPSSGIAQRETEALGPLLVRIRDATNASLLVIEHDMPLITSISDEIVAMDLGRVIARGPADQVVRDPVVVESYLGSSDEVVNRSGTRNGRRPRGTAKARGAAR
jgi:branched-chain amino acid transport system ATP-binding protein